MNKEEILEKSRKEKNDEGVEYAMSKGRKIGMTGFSVMFVVIVLYNLFNGISNYSVFAMFWTYVGFESYGKYSITKGKSELVSTIAGILAGVLFLLCHIMQAMR